MISAADFLRRVYRTLGRVFPRCSMISQAIAYNLFLAFFAALGWTGTLLAGSQVMKLVMQGIHSIYGDKEPLGFLHRQVRGLMLLLVTIAPLLGAAILGILGKPLRRWIALE